MADRRWSNSGCLVIATQAPNSQRMRRLMAGLTIVELLVVIAIIGLLVALLLVAVQESREAARRVGCVANLKQLGLAVANYEQTYKYLPPGVDPNGYSVHFRLLPYLESSDLYDRFDLSRAYDDAPNSAIKEHGVNTFTCPSNPGSVPDNVPDYTSYIAAAGGGNPALQNGIFLTAQRYGVIGLADISDGTTHTAAMSETVAHPYTSPGNVLHGRGVVYKTNVQYTIPGQLEGLIHNCTNGDPIPTHRTLG
ncbi:MAG: DUF1559 domain-containing protein, partial [Planctomycetia bacterium]|nr:DUF1559 domain-containing protein [Planctomycetia bacterium]